MDNGIVGTSLTGCGPNEYARTDGETVVCYPCSQICTSDYLKERYCQSKCPNYIPPTLPTPETSSHDDTLTIVLAISLSVGAVILFIILGVLWRRRRRMKNKKAFHQKKPHQPTEEENPLHRDVEDNTDDGAAQEQADTCTPCVSMSQDEMVANGTVLDRDMPMIDLGAGGRLASQAV